MNYLLDTNACIALINGEPLSVRLRFRKALDDGHELFVSSVVMFELWYGVSKSTRRQRNIELLEEFLSGQIRELPFGEDDAQSAGALRADLELAGKPIGAYDVLIAGQALQHKMILVTANVREFARIKGLTCEHWGKP
ncbi:MAG TPA: type II toxin-antitoxin system VapC family toxin [Candidatus Angelobacter sp.]